ncbi:MAG: hypothetical protein OXC07_06995 [Kistimonas sp.]|nr:hypothetical protein [Kistimonas sp.]
MRDPIHVRALCGGHAFPMPRLRVTNRRLSRLHAYVSPHPARADIRGPGVPGRAVRGIFSNMDTAMLLTLFLIPEGFAAALLKTDKGLASIMDTLVRCQIVALCKGSPAARPRADKGPGSGVSALVGHHTAFV